MWSHTSFYLIFLMSLDCFVQGQIPFPGSCPEVKIVDEFNVDDYMGTWYEYSKYPFIAEAGRKCQQAVYTNNDNGTISVKNSGIFFIVNKAHSTKGIAKIIAPGQLAVSFRGKQTNTPNYLVLGTDYKNWAVVYSCRNMTSFAHTRLLWILVRDRQPLKESVDAAFKIVDANKLTDIFLSKSVQKNCPVIVEEEPEEVESDQSTISDQVTASEPSTEIIINTA